MSPKRSLDDTAEVSEKPHSQPVLGKLSMSPKYVYTDIKENQIRLLSLLPATSVDAPLECKLSVCERGPDLKYEAVSYVWGEDDGQYTQMKVLPTEDNPFPGNKYFLIRPNLVSALKRFRGIRDPRILWTDAICINQDSSLEKSRQVPLMEKTYSEAKNVLIWLGDATETSKIAIAFMHDMIDPSANIGELAKGHAEKWDALESLMRKPWFTRRWIVQEIALAKSAAIHCGQDSISWREFCDAVALFQEYYPDIKHIFLVDAYQYSRNRLGEIQALGACQLIEITSEVFRKANDGSVQRRLLSLESLISRLTMFEARDPRDTIYAMVALAKDIRTVGQKEHTTVPGAFPVETPNEEKMFELSSSNAAKRRKTNNGHGAAELRRIAHEVIAAQNDHAAPANQGGGRRRKGAARIPDLVNELSPPRPKFKVDYERTFLRVCMDFVAFTILQSGSVDIICRPWVPGSRQQQLDLPSWLIGVNANPFRPKSDGTFVRVNGNPLVGQKASQLKWYSACGHRSRATRLRSENPDNGWGFGWFDRKSEFEDPIGEHRSLFVNGFVLDTIDEIEACAADGTIPSEWFDVGGWIDRTSLPPDDLWQTLVADRDMNGKPPKAYYPRTLCNVVQKHCADGSPMNVKMILATPQCDRTAEEVLNRVLEVAPNRRMFRTTSSTKQVLGLAPAKARSRDLICILAGCSVPVILRPQETTLARKKCTYYRLLGDAYVHGFMDGDALEEMEKLDIPWQQFELR